MSQLLPSVFAEEAVAGLASLVRGRVPGDPSDRYFQHNWSALWRELAESGWTAAADGEAPGENGDFSLLELCFLAESWGRFLVPLPLVPTLVARRWSAGRPNPEVRLSYAVAEAGGVLVPHGESAGSVLTGKGLIDRSLLGSAGEIDTWAPSVPIGSYRFTEPGSPSVMLDAAALSASEAVGAAAALLQRTVDYAKVREQFGRPIGTLQAIKHQLADLHCELELARAGIAWSCAERESISAATPAVLAHCLTIAEGCVQIHGGIGYTWESGIHWYYRHVMALRRLVVAAVAAP
jgi:alkylation response protein AidB-like acyl-CoA dehydrogenase